MSGENVSSLYGISILHHYYQHKGDITGQNDKLRYIRCGVPKYLQRLSANYVGETGNQFQNPRE